MLENGEQVRIWLAKGDESDTIPMKLDWNWMKTCAQGGHPKVEFDGQNIIDFADPQPDEKLLQKGVIGFQTCGAEGYSGFVKFRNPRIRELKNAR